MRASPLAICCATRADAGVQPLLRRMSALAETLRAPLVFVVESTEAAARLADLSLPSFMHCVPGQPCWITMQAALSTLHTEYVFFLDDDESCSPALVEWLAAGHYHFGATWLVPRGWLYHDTEHFIEGSTHWPDFQLRIARRVDIQIPTEIHVGWIPRPRPPAPKAAICPYAIEHHKLLIRSYPERLADIASYDARSPGAGTNYAPQYIPEHFNIPSVEWHGGLSHLLV